jgi:hypothetical protein
MTLPQGADYSLTESTLIPIQAEPTQVTKPGGRQKGAGNRATAEARAQN